MKGKGWQPAAAFIFLSLLWGSSFLMIRVLANAGVDALGVGAGRCTLGFLTLIPFAWIRRRDFPRDRRTLALIATLGATNFALPWTLFALAAHHVPSGLSAITNASTPLWAAIFTTIIIREDRLGARGIVGLAAGFTGVLVLMESRLTELNREALLGVPVMLVATASYGLAVAVIRRWLHHVHPIPLTAGQAGVAATLLLPAALLTGAYEGVAWHWQELLSMGILGGIGSGAASTMYMWLIKTIGPVRASSTTYLMPPVGVALGWLFLEETVAWSMLVGVASILFGIALVQGRTAMVARLVLRRPRVTPA